MSEFKLKRITPTLQMIMNSQMHAIMEALNEGSVWHAFDCIKTLVDTLRKEDQKKMREIINPVEKKLKSLTGSRNVDFYTRMLETHKVRDAYLFYHIRRIHRALSALLHAEGYLEHRAKDTPTNVPPATVPD